MVAEKGYHCIQFVRIMSLLGLHTGVQISKEEFIRLLESLRLELRPRYGDSDFDANWYIQNDPDYVQDDLRRLCQVSEERLCIQPSQKHYNLQKEVESCGI
jgi:hypothetical protein